MPPTFQIATPAGHIVVMREYITSKEYWKIKNVYIRADKASDDQEAVSVGQKGEEKALQLVIVTFDGMPFDIDVIRALPLADYMALTEAAEPIIDPKKKSVNL
jgi:hypothetical protein